MRDKQTEPSDRQRRAIIASLDEMMRTWPLHPGRPRDKLGHSWHAITGSHYHSFKYFPSPNYGYDSREMSKLTLKEVIPGKARNLNASINALVNKHTITARHSDFLAAVVTPSWSVGSSWQSILAAVLMAEHCNITTPTALRNSRELIKNSIALYLVEDNYIGILHNPVEVHFREGTNLLHNDKGAAVTWLAPGQDGNLLGINNVTDDFDNAEGRRGEINAGWNIVRPGLTTREEMWLNGIRVPGWLIYEDMEKWGPEILTRDPNADVQREVVRTLGEERLLTVMNATEIDRDNSRGYVLYSMPRPAGIVVPTATTWRPDRDKQWKYLRMMNPSVEGMVHVEPVDPDCLTVQQAINWRGTGLIDREWMPKQLT